MKMPATRPTRAFDCNRDAHAGRCSAWLAYFLKWVRLTSSAQNTLPFSKWQKIVASFPSATSIIGEVNRLVRVMAFVTSFADNSAFALAMASLVAVYFAFGGNY